MPHPDLAIVTGGQIIPAISQNFPRLYHVALDVVHVVRARWYSQASFLGPASSTSSYPYTCRARTSFVGRSVPYLLFLSERRSPIEVTASVGVSPCSIRSRRPDSGHEGGLSSSRADLDS